MNETLPVTGSVDGAPSTPGRPLGLGTAVGRYIVLEMIGEGGMGRVYKAYDPDLDRRIALKLVRADLRNPSHRQRLRARLVREAQALARLSHRNVVSVYDVGTHDDDVFVAMELVDGVTLTAALAEMPAAARVFELFRGAGQGLAAAHEVGIVHRDFKPDNVIVGRDGTVRVLDFGLARAIVDDDDEARAGIADGDPFVTQAGAVVGTPAYMAPEQRAGDELDARADQFSFCVALYEALFHALPADGAQTMPSRTASGRRIPPRIRAALARGLAPDPAARFDSMNDLLCKLELTHARRNWIVGGVALCAAAAVAIAFATRPESAVSCLGGEERLAGVWDPARKAAVHTAIARHSGAVAATVEKSLDRYASAWLAMRSASCQATHETGEQSAELLDLRTECLDRHLEEAAQLTKLLAEADAATAARAVASVDALAPLEECANITALRDPIRPRDPARARLLRDRFARARAKFHVGSHEDVAHESAALAKEADDAGDRWLAANATYLQARATRQLGDTAGAEALLYRAIEAAEAARASDVVVEAWMALAWIAGEDAGRYADALRLAGIARGVLERLGGDPRVEASLEDHLGVIHLDQGSLTAARLHLERGLALREKVYGKQDSEYAASLQHVAILEQATGNLEKSLALHQQARAITESELGPEHPDVLAMISGEGAGLYELGRYREAADLLARHLPIVDKVVGASSELAAVFSMNLGVAYWKLADLSAATASLERARTIVERHAAHSRRAANIYLNLAHVALEREDHTAARAHAQRAAADLETLLGRDHPDLAMALEAHATAALALEQPADAVAPLERALAIRTRTPGNASDLAITQFDLARALVGSRGDARRARGLAEQARSALVLAGDAEGAREVATWLAAQR